MRLVNKMEQTSPINTNFKLDTLKKKTHLIRSQYLTLYAPAWFTGYEKYIHSLCDIFTMRTNGCKKKEIHKNRFMCFYYHYVCTLRCILVVKREYKSVYSETI